MSEKKHKKPTLPCDRKEDWFSVIKCTLAFEIFREFPGDGGPYGSFYLSEKLTYKGLQRSKIVSAIYRTIQFTIIGLVVAVFLMSQDLSFGLGIFLLLCDIAVVSFLIYHSWS